MGDIPNTIIMSNYEIFIEFFNCETNSNYGYAILKTFDRGVSYNIVINNIDVNVYWPSSEEIGNILLTFSGGRMANFAWNGESWDVDSDYVLPF